MIAAAVAFASALQAAPYRDPLQFVRTERSAVRSEVPVVSPSHGRRGATGSVRMKSNEEAWDRSADESRRVSVPPKGSRRKREWVTVVPDAVPESPACEPAPDALPGQVLWRYEGKGRKSK